MTEGKRASIKDVAKLAGVSLGTVSRTINDSGSVSKESRERVERAVRMLGYVPNHAAQSLRRGSTAMLAYMFPDIGNPLYTSLYQRLEREFQARGYISVLSNSGADLEREVDTIARFQDRGVDLMVVAPSHEKEPRLIRAIDEAVSPVIVLDRDIPVNRDTIWFDHRQAMRLCVDHLVQQGHTRIGLVTWTSHSRPARLRKQGFLEAMEAHGLDGTGRIAHAASSTASARGPVVELLDAPDRPTALIAHGSNIVVSALRAIEDRGMSVPGDIAVISGGRNEFLNLYRPDVPYVSLDSAMLIETMLHAVGRRIDNPRDGDRLDVNIGFCLESLSATS